MWTKTTRLLSSIWIRVIIALQYSALSFLLRMITLLVGYLSGNIYLMILDVANIQQSPGYANHKPFINTNTSWMSLAETRHKFHKIRTLHRVICDESDWNDQNLANGCRCFYLPTLERITCCCFWKKHVANLKYITNGQTGVMRLNMYAKQEHDNYGVEGSEDSTKKIEKSGEDEVENEGKTR